MMNNDNDFYKYSDILCHHGVKGQKWGVRRYQNKDGSLTKAGKDRLSKMSDKELQDAIKRAQLERRYAASMNRNSSGRKLVGLAGRALGIASQATDLAPTKKIPSKKEFKKMEAAGTMTKAQFDALKRRKANTEATKNIASKALSIGEKAFGGVENAKRTKRYNLNVISTEDLEKLVRRSELEKHYIDEVKNKKLNDAIDMANSILGTVGAVVGMTAAGVSVYKTVKELKK